jgi:hypothetical protein
MLIHINSGGAQRALAGVRLPFTGCDVALSVGAKGQGAGIGQMS